MSSIEVYSPLDTALHLSLPYDHTNSVYSTSPFTYKLDEEFDFAEIFPLEPGGRPRVALDSALVTSLFWAATRTKQVINRATRGVVPAVNVGAVIPDSLFKSLGMKKPRLVTLFERTNINPLLNIGDRDILTRLFRGLQQIGREAIDWIVEAKWRSQLMGNHSRWDWEDPRTLRPLGSWIDSSRLVAGTPYNSPAPASPSTTAYSSSANSTTALPPSSPTSAFLPFSAGGESQHGNAEDDVELLLQVVLHPTASRYALRYPLIDVFDGNPHINNGYVEEIGGDAMDVDED
ncbi:hypothetical protein H1R20_g11252, partial [Candolleomyces eurysporus]